MAKRLVSVVGLSLSAVALSAFLAHAGPKIDGGKFKNQLTARDSLAVGLLKGEANQGAVIVEGNLRNVEVENDVTLQKALCVGLLKGKCNQGVVRFK